jgi:hypothetical protein
MFVLRAKIAEKAVIDQTNRRCFDCQNSEKPAAYLKPGRRQMSATHFEN